MILCNPQVAKLIEASCDVKLYIIISTQVDKKGKISSLTTKNNCDKMEKFKKLKTILVKSFKCDSVSMFAYYIYII